MSRPADWGVLDLEHDPTPGDPFAVRELARRFLEFAADVGHARGQVIATTAGGVVQSWLGAAGDAFRDELDEFPGQLSRLETSYRMAGQALSAYEPILDTAQTQADRALARGRDARARRDHAQTLLDPAQTALATATTTLTNLAPAPYAATIEIPLPDPAQLTAALRNRDAAQTRLDQAHATVHTAEDDLDAARRLALAAGQLRANAAHTCVRAIRDASHSGIHNTPRWSWEKIRQTAGAVWHTAVQVAKITVAVLGVVAMIIGGPVAWVVFAAALIVLADTLARYASGEASGWEVGFALLGCIPGSKGLTTTAGLAHGLRGATQALRDGRALTAVVHSGDALTSDALTAARTHLTTIATNLRGARAHTTTLVKNLFPHTAAVTPDGHILMAASEPLSNAHRTAKEAFTAAGKSSHTGKDGTGIPFGFTDEIELRSFSNILHTGLRSRGFPDVVGIMQGSSVTGVKYTTGTPFDVGRRSDFDIALAGENLFNKALKIGVRARSGGMRTGPLTPLELARLDLFDLQQQLTDTTGRKVAFMLYRNLATAVSRGPSIPLPRP